MHAGFKSQQLEEEPRRYGPSPDGTTSIETASSGGTRPFWIVMSPHHLVNRSRLQRAALWGVLNHENISETYSTSQKNNHFWVFDYSPPLSFPCFPVLRVSHFLKNRGSVFQKFVTWKTKRGCSSVFPRHKLKIKVRRKTLLRENRKTELVDLIWLWQGCEVSSVLAMSQMLMKKRTIKKGGGYITTLPQPYLSILRHKKRLLTLQACHFR